MKILKIISKIIFYCAIIPYMVVLILQYAIDENTLKEMGIDIKLFQLIFLILLSIYLIIVAYLSIAKMKKKNK